MGRVSDGHLPEGWEMEYEHAHRRLLISIPDTDEQEIAEAFRHMQDASFLHSVSIEEIHMAASALLAELERRDESN